MKRLMTIIFLLFVLIACGKKYTVDDFVKNQEIRENISYKCKNGDIHPDDINCINVIRAEEKIAMEHDKYPNHSWN